MLDPVANTLDLRAPFDKSRAARVQRAMAANKVGLSDVAYFDNMLVDDKAARKAKHDFMLRVFDAAVLLGTDAVCGFVGRNIKLEMDENLVMFEQEFIPLLKEAKARGLSRVPGSRCIASARSTASATTSASTTTRRTRSSWARTRARSSSTSKTRATASSSAAST
jgi:hypothetical protein